MQLQEALTRVCKGTRGRRLLDSRTPSGGREAFAFSLTVTRLNTDWLISGLRWRIIIQCMSGTRTLLHSFNIEPAESANVL